MPDEIKMSEQALSLKPGIYEHYSGKKYDLVGVAHHSETLEEVVVYRARYGEKLIWVRPLGMFLETVEHEGVIKPRFRYIGDDNNESR
ncbi:MAG: DUF1653 domain-containing protein [Candidatus Shapirobacteria bacterium]|jgi:hypothetical protein